MWSHVVAAPATPPALDLYLTGSSRYLWRLHLAGGTADELPAVPVIGGPVDEFYEETKWDFADSIGVAGNPFAETDGTLWMHGAFVSYGTDPDLPYFGPKWISPQINAGFHAIAPLDPDGTNSYSNIKHAWPRPGGGLLIVGRGSLIHEYAGGGAAPTTATTDPNWWNRTADHFSGSAYSPHALAFVTTPSYPFLTGRPLLIFRQAGQWWTVAAGSLNVEISGTPYSVEAFGLWTPSGTPTDPESWDAATHWSGYDLDALLAGSSSELTSYGTMLPAAYKGNQVLAWGSDVYILTRMARDSATAGRAAPADPTCIRRMDSSGALHNEFALPAPSYSGTETHVGCMALYDGDLYVAVLEGWPNGASTSGNTTLVLYRRNGGTWIEVAHWTRTRLAFGSPRIGSMIEAGGELIIALASPVGWSTKSTYGLMCWSADGGWREDPQISTLTRFRGTGSVMPRLFFG